MTNDEDIHFKQMPGFSFGMPEQEKTYDSLYDELSDKCNPRNFSIEEAGLAKFQLANEIFSTLKSIRSTTTDADLLKLRNDAIGLLGVHISTTKIFNRLKAILDPTNYVDRQPYNKSLIAKCGVLYNELLNNKDDIQALERLELQCGALADEIDDYDYQSLDIHHYLNLHPSGKHAEEVKLFYDGQHGKYLKQYPNGKYAANAAIEVKSETRALVLIFVVLIFTVILFVIVGYRS